MNLQHFHIEDTPLPEPRSYLDDTVVAQLAMIAVARPELAAHIRNELEVISAALGVGIRALVPCRHGLAAQLDLPDENGECPIRCITLPGERTY